MTKRAIIHRTDRHYIVEITGLPRRDTQRGFKARYMIQTTEHEVLDIFYTEAEAKAKVAELEAA